MEAVGRLRLLLIQLKKEVPPMHCRKYHYSVSGRIFKDWFHEIEAHDFSIGKLAATVPPVSVNRDIWLP
jgi:hypothetical protein